MNNPIEDALDLFAALGWELLRCTCEPKDLRVLIPLANTKGKRAIMYACTKHAAEIADKL